MNRTRHDNSGEGPHPEPIVVYRRLLSYSGRHWKMFIPAVLAMIFYAATDTAFAALMKPLLDSGFIARNEGISRYIPIAIIVLFMVRGFAGFASDYCMNWVSRHIIKTLREQVFDHLLALPCTYYDRNSSGVLLSKLTYNIEQVADSATKSITVAIRDSLTIIGLVSWMFYLSPTLVVFIFVITPLIGMLILYLSRRYRRYNTRIQESMGNVTRVSEEVIQAHRVIKVFNGQNYERNQFGQVNENNRKLHMRLTVARAASEPIIMLIAGLGVAAIIYVATLESMSATISGGTFVSFLSAMLLVMAPLKRVTNINASLQQGIAAGQSIFSLLEQDTEPRGGDYRCERVRGEVEFRHLRFAYTEENGTVLEDIDLKVPAGSTVAFVGRSGSGKSTLISLLPRFYELTDGQILIDGRDIRDYAVSNLREQISLVSQDVTLFNDTILSNIAYGGLGDSSREEVEAAAVAAHVMEFVQDLPDGLETIVGDRGVLLSGGQRQRIAIARALLKNAPILILDEATSSLDTESERHIQNALDGLMRGRTTLVIAHRLSTVEKADRIVVLRDGRVVESGAHEELLAAGGDYAGLYRMQFGESGSVASTSNSS